MIAKWTLVRELQKRSHDSQDRVAIAMEFFMTSRIVHDGSEGKMKRVLGW